jgi:sec-independent protein translocase protein TatA
MRPAPRSLCRLPKGRGYWVDLHEQRIDASERGPTIGALSPAHLVIVLIIAVLIIGPGKLPDTGAALGKAIRDFRRAAAGETGEATEPPTDR